MTQNIALNSLFVRAQLIKNKISTLQIMYTSQYSAQSCLYVFVAFILNELENVA
jgi:hypothetical protein